MFVSCLKSLYRRRPHASTCQAGRIELARAIGCERGFNSRAITCERGFSSRVGALLRLHDIQQLRECYRGALANLVHLKTAERMLDLEQRQVRYPEHLRLRAAELH